MFYSYITLADEARLSYAEIQDDHTPTVAVERPRDWGFDSTDCLLPAHAWSSVGGFSEHDLVSLTQLIRNNAPLIFRLAAEVSKAYA